MKRSIAFSTLALLTFIYCTCATMLLLAACVNHIAGEEETAVSGERHKVRITTRGGEAALPYPVSVYAFGTDGACVAQQTVTTATDALSLSLPTGTYSLVALAGTDDYTLPNPITLTSAITLKSGKSTASSALMMGSADITLATANMATTITLSYRVAQISLTLSDVPQGTTAVSVSFSPLNTTLMANGNYGGAGQTSIVTCSKTTTTDVWKADNFYIFPGSGQQTVFSITITNAQGEVNTYGYTYNKPLLAATPYLLSGSYQQGLGVSGELKYEGWQPPVDVIFSFGNDTNSDTGSDTNLTVDEIPTAASIWQGHVIALVQNKTATGADLLLLSLKEWTDVSSALNATRSTQAAMIASSYTESGLASEWRIPTTAEANLLRNNYGTAAGLNLINNEIDKAGGIALTATGNDSNGNAIRYLCNDAESSFTLSGTTNSTSAAGSTRTYYLRLVRTIHITLNKQ